MCAGGCESIRWIECKEREDLYPARYHVCKSAYRGLM
jgi:hypothetical protein